MARLSSPYWIVARSNAALKPKRVSRSGRQRKPTDEHREPALSCTIHDERLKAGFDVSSSSATKRTRSSEPDRPRRAGPHLSVRPLVHPRRKIAATNLASRRRSVCNQVIDALCRSLCLAMLSHTGPICVIPVGVVEVAALLKGGRA